MTSLLALAPSKFLKSLDLNGQQPVYTVDHIAMEQMGGGQTKPILYFREIKKGMVLNRTNLENLADGFGDDQNAVIGQLVELYIEKTRNPNGAGRVDGLRVRKFVDDRVQAQRPQQRPATGGYAAQPRAANQPAQRRPARDDDGSDLDSRCGPPRDDMDDRIPF